MEQVDIEEQLRIKVEHDEARTIHRPRKEAPKPSPARRFQNPPPNRSTYRPPPIPPYQECYPARRTPPRAVSQLKEVAHIVGDDNAYNHYTPLNASQEAFYLAIRDKGLLRKPDPMKAPADRRNRFKYCDFHEDVGHNTSECYNFRNQIEGLVKGGLLSEFLQRVRDSIKEGKQVQSDMQKVAERRREGEKDLMQ